MATPQHARAGDLLHPLLAEMLQAHGGLQHWRTFKGISSTVAAHGRLLGPKGLRLPPGSRAVTTDFHRQWANITPFGDRDWTLNWTPVRVLVHNRAGEIIGARTDPRKTISGRGPNSRWDSFDLAYLTGYALWNCHALPFALAEPGYEVSDVAPIAHEGKLLRGISVRFPANIHSHCREQQFYVDDAGLLVRHDYDVDVMDGAPAADLLSGYIMVDGLAMPSRRRIYPRDQDGSLGQDLDAGMIDFSNHVLR